jgi:O-antigen/teichoic acid export membrane protein
MPVLYSHFSGIQDDRERVKAHLFKIIRIITFISIPLDFLINVMSQPISDLVFGKNWSGISVVIAFLSLTHGFAWVVGANAEAFRSIGHPDIETKAMFFTMPIYLLAYAYYVQFGLEAFLGSRFAMVFIGITVQLYFLSNTLGFRVSFICRYAAKITIICLFSFFVCPTATSLICSTTTK